jgi:hypothetical protein
MTVSQSNTSLVCFSSLQDIPDGFRRFESFREWYDVGEEVHLNSSYYANIAGLYWVCLIPSSAKKRTTLASALAAIKNHRGGQPVNAGRFVSASLEGNSLKWQVHFSCEHGL